MHITFYQVLHPWHWLTYGQNAAALAGLAAIAGTFILYRYTVYTRRMMETQVHTMDLQVKAMGIQTQTLKMQGELLKMQESSTIAAITPNLVAQRDVEFAPTHLEDIDGADIGIQARKVALYKAVLSIRNVGAGAALFVKGWNHPLDDGFVADSSDLLVNKGQINEIWAQLTELMTGESTSITFEGFKPVDIQRSWIFVIDTIDQTNRKHQLRLVRAPRAGGQMDISISMHHQKEGGGSKS
jgi:hypothetical protein